MCQAWLQTPQSCRFESTEQAFLLERFIKRYAQCQIEDLSAEGRVHDLESISLTSPLKTLTENGGRV